MDINTITPNDFNNLFSVDMSGAPAPKTPEQQLSQQISNSVEQNVDMSKPIVTTVETTTQIVTTGETTTQVPNTDITAGEEEGAGEEDKGKPGRKAKPVFEGMSSYLEDRIKSGKFVAMEEEIDGNTQVFIPKTAEEVDEFIDTQINYKLENSRKENDERWYNAKTPAWKAIAQYAELVDNPADVIPFIQGVQNISSVSTLDEKDIDGAEQIVRIRLQQRGETEESIDNNIEALKSTDKLIAQASAYKPLILQEEKRNLSQMMEEENRQEIAYKETLAHIKDGVVKAIQTPLFGKKLKQDEQVAVYQLIGEPSDETQGFGIYNEIDTLFEKGDFDTLRQVALFLKKKDKFLGYISSQEANRVSEGLQRTLRVANEGRSTGNRQTTADDETPRATIKRDPYKTGPKLSGFKN